MAAWRQTEKVGLKSSSGGSDACPVSSLRRAPMSGLRAIRIDHASVIITDLERSRRFYADVLGLREVAPPYTFDFVVLWFEVGEGQYVHVLHKPQPDTISPRHFALHVAD